ncbi:MAG: hypothetical protein ACYDG6_05875 [Thermincolia bacterium]
MVFIQHIHTCNFQRLLGVIDFKDNKPLTVATLNDEHIAMALAENFAALTIYILHSTTCFSNTVAKGDNRIQVQGRPCHHSFCVCDNFH